MAHFDGQQRLSMRQAILDGVSSRVVYVGNACDSYPCWNDAFCIPSNFSSSAFTCICADDYAGELCQYKLSDFCKGQNCEEGTECTVRNGFAECVPHDSLAFFPSCDQGLCLNGAKCVEVASDRYKCLCAEGYHGVYCQLDKSVQFPTLSIASAIFLFGLLLLIMLSVLLICHSNNIGCYLITPGERSYTRWDEEDGDRDDDRIPLEVIQSQPIKTSTTADTIVDMEASSLQRTTRGETTSVAL